VCPLTLRIPQTYAFFLSLFPDLQFCTLYQVLSTSEPQGLPIIAWLESKQRTTFPVLCFKGTNISLKC
jgi:hypothetical protein